MPISSISSWSDVFPSHKRRRRPRGHHKKPEHGRVPDRERGKEKEKHNKARPGERSPSPKRQHGHRRQKSPRRDEDNMSETSTSSPASMSLDMPSFPSNPPKMPHHEKTDRIRKHYERGSVNTNNTNNTYGKRMNTRLQERKARVNKAQQFVDAFCSNIDKVLDLIPENIVLTIHDQTQKIPYAGTFNGRKQVLDSLTKYSTHAKIISSTRGETFCNRGITRITISADIHARLCLDANDKDKTPYASKVFFCFDYADSQEFSRVDIFHETGPLALFFSPKAKVEHDDDLLKIGTGQVLQEHHVVITQDAPVLAPTPAMKPLEQVQ